MLLFRTLPLRLLLSGVYSSDRDGRFASTQRERSFEAPVSSMSIAAKGGIDLTNFRIEGREFRLSQESSKLRRGWCRHVWPPLERDLSDSVLSACSIQAAPGKFRATYMKREQFSSLLHLDVQIAVLSCVRLLGLCCTMD